MVIGRLKEEAARLREQRDVSCKKEQQWKSKYETAERELNLVQLQLAETSAELADTKTLTSQLQAKTRSSLMSLKSGLTAVETTMAERMMHARDASESLLSLVKQLQCAVRPEHADSSERVARLFNMIRRTVQMLHDTCGTLPATASTRLKDSKLTSDVGKQSAPITAQSVALQEIDRLEAENRVLCARIEEIRAEMKRQSSQHSSVLQLVPRYRAAVTKARSHVKDLYDKIAQLQRDKEELQQQRVEQVPVDKDENLRKQVEESHLSLKAIVAQQQSKIYELEQTIHEQQRDIQDALQLVVEQRTGTSQVLQSTSNASVRGAVLSDLADQFMLQDSYIHQGTQGSHITNASNFLKEQPQQQHSAVRKLKQPEHASAAAALSGSPASQRSALAPEALRVELSTLDSELFVLQKSLLAAASMFTDSASN
eukprot:TRINITY_DN3338_c0_g1_i3.p1 TRINITY_DN3338_c0_g1~~TRINITY_DN3338_c0_g1_i3.p1  ORF type:complete len:428 (-),score=113.37 TRINITY_DN3338_c0_g1_i3:110-1393(-)